MSALEMFTLECPECGEQFMAYLPQEGEDYDSLPYTVEKVCPACGHEFDVTFYPSDAEDVKCNVEVEA